MTKRNGFWRKTLSAALSYALIFGQIAQPLHAASTDISDVPLIVKNTVASNIMFTLDDSGSMQWEYLPDEQMQSSLWMFPRPSNPYGGGGGDYTNAVPNFDDGPLPGTRINVHHYTGRSSENNRAFYNQSITYRPWSNGDATLWADANPAAAMYNPAIPAVGTINLTVANTQSAVWFSDRGNGNPGNRGTELCDGGGCGSVNTFNPITYFRYNGPATAAGRLLRSNYTKVEITSATPVGNTYSYVDASDGVTKTRTRDEEIQNFANWFQYYRSRISASRAGIGRAFSALSESPRVGFGTINTNIGTIDGVASTGTVSRGVRIFTGADRTAFFTSLYGVDIPAQGTPLRRALDDVGQYFSRTDLSGPWGQNPGVGGGTQFTCRQNYHILMTDGYWNSGAAPAGTAGARANVDNATGATHVGTNPLTGAPISYQYVPANAFRDSFADTLADVAMYYWVRDLRPDLTNNVFPNATNPAFWQHVSTFTVALGVNGTISQNTLNTAFSRLASFSGFDANRDNFLTRAEVSGSGFFAAAFTALDTNSDNLLSLAEFLPAITWPDPTPGANDRQKIDDLAHAALNSRGAYFNAANPDTFAQSLTAALESIVANTSAAAAVSVGNPIIVGTDNKGYISSFLPGNTWSGELKSVNINVTNGIADEATPNWSAQALLDAKNYTTRLIATHTGLAGNGQGIQFRRTTDATVTKLSAAQQALLNTPVAPPGLTDGANVVEYIRGRRLLEGSLYRRRAHVLGDIINAQAVVIRPPDSAYADTGYVAFRNAQRARPQIVLQGANDGMLHAFDGGFVPNPNPPAITGSAGSGQELWGYIPTFVLPNLNNLSRRVGYTHKMYVDGQVSTSDVDFNRTGGVFGSGDWRTIAVGGLGKGGRGFYALDVTTTTAANEAAVASKVLWEFPNSGTPAADRPNVGFSFGKPIIIKTKARGWVTLVTSGYNNGTNAGDSGGNGQGYLYVLNAKTGDVIRSIGTGAGTVTTPSGLAYISAYVENGDVDSTVEYVYGGDVLGNLWRFDLTHATDSAQWTVTKLATLVDSLGNFQPVTSEPELAKILVGTSYKRYVYVGTGLYFGDKDIPGVPGANAHAAQVQTMYALVDDLSIPGAGTPVITPLRTNLQQQTLAGAGNRTASAGALDLTKKGWYVDLPATGERMFTAPAIGLGAIVFTSDAPSSDPCELGGDGYFNVLDYKTGGYLAGNPPGTPSSVKYDRRLISAGTLVQLASGRVVGLARLSDNTTVTNTAAPQPTGTSTRRKSWRELLM